MGFCSFYKSSNDLEVWLFDRSELEAAIDEKSSILYILMTCQTDDTVRAEAYQKFIEDVIPKIKPYDDQMDQYFLTITGSPKPKYRTLVEICESTGCNSKRVLMIGDSYSDFDAAKQAKTSFVGLVPNQLFSPFPASVHLIKDLNTLPILINN